MIDILVQPGTPFFLASMVGICIALLGMQRMAAVRALVATTRTAATWDGRRRMLVGQLAGGMLAGMLLLTTIALGLVGTNRTLALVSAVGIYLYLGMVVPRRPIVQAQKARKRLRMLTPGFVSYVRVALAGSESPGDILSRYVKRPRPKIAVMQAVASEALHVMEATRTRPFAALAQVARQRDCRELIDVTEALAQAEAEGADVQMVLEAHEITVQQILRDEFTQMLKRRTLYLIGLVAVSLVIGIMGNLLFVITGGGAVLMGTGV